MFTYFASCPHASSSLSPGPSPADHALCFRPVCPQRLSRDHHAGDRPARRDQRSAALPPFSQQGKLYWTIIEEQCGARGRRQKLDRILDQGGSDLEVFSAIAREFLTRNARDTELTRLLWFTALENHTLSQRFFRTFVAVYYEALAAYIRRRVQ